MNLLTKYEISVSTTEFLINYIDDVGGKLSTALDLVDTIKKSGDKSWRRKKDAEIFKYRGIINEISMELDSRKLI